MQAVIAVSYFLLQSDGQETGVGGGVLTQAARVTNPKNAMAFTRDPLSEQSSKSRRSDRFTVRSRGIGVSNNPFAQHAYPLQTWAQDFGWDGRTFAPAL